MLTLEHGYRQEIIIVANALIRIKVLSLDKIGNIRTDIAASPSITIYPAELYRSSKQGTSYPIITLKGGRNMSIPHLWKKLRSPIQLLKIHQTHGILAIAEQ